MFLSLLDVNVGADPDRPRPGPAVAPQPVPRPPAAVHGVSVGGAEIGRSRLPRAVQPRQDFGTGEPKQVHVERGRRRRVFFSASTRKPAAASAILVQSAARPDWDYAFHNAGHLLAARAAGEAARSALSRQASGFGSACWQIPPARSTPRAGRTGERNNGKRVPVPRRPVVRLARPPRRARRGSPLSRAPSTVQPGYVYINKERNGRGQSPALGPLRRHAHGHRPALPGNAYPRHRARQGIRLRPAQPGEDIAMKDLTNSPASPTA